MLSNGNFHPMVLALALDALRPAAAHVGQLSDRRMNHLWASVADVFSDEGVMDRLVDEGGGLSRYAAAALASELRHAANPVSLDVGILDLGIEDHATNAPVAAALTERALDLLEGILTIELEMARIAHDLRPATGGAAPGGRRPRSRASARSPGVAGPRPSSAARSTRPSHGRCATPCSTRRGRRSRPADRRRLLPSAGHVRPPALLPDDRDRVREQRARASTPCTR